MWWTTCVTPPCLDDRRIAAYALAAPERWGEVRPLFAEMLDSMTLFAP